MKILMVNHLPLIGSGSGVYVTNIARSLVRKGHEVCIITPENTSTGTTLKGIKTHSVFFLHKEKIDGQLNFNFPCFELHTRSSETFYNLSDEQIEEYKNAFRKAIKEEIKEFKPDVIHAQHIWILSDVVSEFNIPFVITSHGSDMMGSRKTNRFRKECENAIDKCKKVVAISKRNYKEIINAYPNANGKTVIIENGFDKNEFFIQKCDKKEILLNYNIENEYKKIVVFAGRLAKNKGVDILLKAAKQYETDETLTIVAGGGKLRKDLIQMADDLELKNIKFIGNQSHDALRKIFNISNVMAMPSREEAFGLSALEALACGIPVVGTNSGGMPDFINEDVGILIDIENPDMLATSINKILNKEKKYNKEKIAQYALDEYSQDNFIKYLVKLFEEV